MRDNVVLITGGTGSFGQAMTKELLTKGVKQIRIFSRDELKQAQMRESFKDPRVEYLLGDIRDYDRLCMALAGVDIVIHAAALKRIEVGERDPQEFVKTNVQGTINVANACLKNNIKKAVLISTDKVAYAINLYGATKLVAEKVWLQSNVYRGNNFSTVFSAVRYGNVLGSRGSVLHLFNEQKSKGSVKVTDADMTRFFITLQQAVDLVQAALEFSQGGEIFIPQLKAANIYHLAKLVAGSCPVEITNTRGGEKLHESLITKEEAKRLASYEHYSIINPEITTWPYHKWSSEIRVWAEDSSKADQYTEHELRKLIASIK